MHIGSLIKQRALEMRIGPSEIAEMINSSKQNVYSIYKRKSLDTEVLFKLSIALKFNFFETYREHLRTKGLAIDVNADISDGLKNKEALEKELMILKEKCELLTKLNSLMEKNLREKTN